jgi:hypothetical protein
MPQNEKALLAKLLHERVEFVVIGGVCGVMHGLPLVTLDLDICCGFGSANLRRLEAALRDLHPWHRFTPNHLPFALTDELCSSLKNLYLHTDSGDLDCLSEVLGVGDYTSVLEHSIEFEMSFGPVRVLDLDTLIVAKEALGTEKDKYALRLLKAIAERKPPGR